MRWKHPTARYVQLPLIGCLVLILLAGCGPSGNMTTRMLSHPTPIVQSGNGAINAPVASTGCGTATAIKPGTSADVSIPAHPMFANGATTRLYRIHIPASYDSHQQTPLLLDFHGHGGTASGEDHGRGFSALADQQRFIVVYPQGLLDSTHEPFWASIGTLDYGIDDVLFVSDVLNDVQSHYCVDPQRIYAAGFSNGGGMTGLLACRLAGRIAAFAPVSGNYYALYGGCHPGRPVSLLEIHGSADRVVPYHGIPFWENPSFPLPDVLDWLQQWAVRDGCANMPQIVVHQTTVTGLRWASCQGGATIAHYRVEGGGHSLPAALAGQPSLSVIWRFLQSHPLPSPVAARPQPSPSAAIKEFPLPTPDTFPTGIVAGPNHALWFTENNVNAVGQITLAGMTTEYHVPTAQGLDQIALGPDGTLWFTDDFANAIRRITPTGTLTGFALPGSSDYPTGMTTGITPGPDGNLWFAEPFMNAIGRVTPGGSISTFRIPTAQSGPADIVSGPDGALWFTEFNGNAIGRVTTTGVFQEFPLPTPASGPMGITRGPDGSVWFCEQDGNKIGRITPAGQITEFPLHTAQSRVTSITAGPDGNLWFTEADNNAVGRITPEGSIMEFFTPTPLSAPLGITTGADGAIWFTEEAISAIGRMQV